MRDLVFDFALQLFDIDVQFVPIDRTVGLEVENDRKSVTPQRRLIEHAFNSVNGDLVPRPTDKRTRDPLVSGDKPYCERRRQLGQRETLCL